MSESPYQPPTCTDASVPPQRRIEVSRIRAPFRLVAAGISGIPLGVVAYQWLHFRMGMDGVLAATACVLFALRFAHAAVAGEWWSWRRRDLVD